MTDIKALDLSRLHAIFDPARIPYENSDGIPQEKNSKALKEAFQPRAIHALDLALNIKTPGYNIYLSGEAGLGRTHMLLSYLESRALKRPPSPDLAYVRNFSDPDAPLLLVLPAGLGKILKDNINSLLENIQKELALHFDKMNFIRQRAELMDKFQSTRLCLMQQMNDLAENKGFSLDVDENGVFTLSPLSKEKLAEAASAPPSPDREGAVAQSLAGLMRELGKAEENFHSDEKKLECQAMTKVLKKQFEPLRNRLQKACNSPQFNKFLSELEEDIIKNVDAFLPRDNVSRFTPTDGRPSYSQDNFFKRYEINLFVDNHELKGAPIIVEDNPTAANLLGCIERESEMGALITDFSLIRSGSLHRANGGFLILHIEDILEHPSAWDGLLRALQSNLAKIEDQGEFTDVAVRTKTLHPHPLPLDLKVILIGDEDVYETLLLNDTRFAKLFLIKAHMTDVADRTLPNIKIYLSHIANIIRENDLLPFDRSALAWLVDLGSHLSEDQRKLSLKFPKLREMMIESNALANMEKSSVVTAEILESAFSRRAFRENLIEEIFMEEYDREKIKVRTSGKAIGQINGLSVVWNGDFEFGLPHRISCTVGVGSDGLIDLEREAELGGPIHTKAMMILKSCLTDLFARKKPLVFSASLYFEQSYANIEGDSASGAELAALISALAEIPMRLDLAFTGAVSQSGQILAVGGVTRKIEGFYKVCLRHGLTGTQGVIIPKDNIDHLMLSTDVLESVKNGKFSIYAVSKIEEALFLLSGLNAGKKHKNGGFTAGSLYDLVDKRLFALGCHAQEAFRKPRNQRQ